MNFKKGDWVVYLTDDNQVSRPFQLDEDSKDGLVKDRRYGGRYNVSHDRVRLLSKGGAQKIIENLEAEIENIQARVSVWKSIKESLP